MIGKSTEKAIKAWLALPEEQRYLDISVGRSPSIFLSHVQPSAGTEKRICTVVAKFSIRSIVAKRYPRRKKVKK